MGWSTLYVLGGFAEIIIYIFRFTSLMFCVCICFQMCSTSTGPHIDTSARQHVNLQHVNTSTRQHARTSARQHISTSAHQHVNMSTRQHIDTSRHRRPQHASEGRGKGGKGKGRQRIQKPKKTKNGGPKFEAQKWHQFLVPANTFFFLGGAKSGSQKSTKVAPPKN